MRRRLAFYTLRKSVKVESPRVYPQRFADLARRGCRIEGYTITSPIRPDDHPAALPAPQEIHAAVWYGPANLLDDVPLAAIGFPYEPLEVLPGQRFASRARAAYQQVPGR